MAIDTTSKQWSIIGLLSPWRSPPIPGAAAEEDRLHYLLLYSGITAADPSMALVTRKALGTRGRESASHQRHSDQSASGANLTVSTPSGNVRRLLMVTVKYTAAATVNVTVTVNSGAGADRDTIINTMALSAATDDVFIPSGPVILSDNDTIDVFAPLLAAETSSVVIYSEVW